MEVSNHDVSDLDLATDAPGFGMLDEDSAPETPPVAEQPRDEQGRFAPKDETPTEETPAEDAPAAADTPVEDAPAAETPPETPPERHKDSPEELAKKKIPYKRFKEAVEQERGKVRALEERLRAAEERLNKPDTVSIDDSSLKQLGDLLIEGKTDEFAAQLRGVLSSVAEQTKKDAIERATAQHTREAVHMTAEMERQAAADSWAAKYPVFNPTHESYDESLTGEAIALRDAYESRGFTPAEALARAVQVVTGMYGIAAPDAAPEPAAPAPKLPPRQPVSKKLEAAAAQPPRVAGAAAGEVDKPTTILQRMAAMTPEEFDKIPEAELEKLRNGTYG